MSTPNLAFQCTGTSRPRLCFDDVNGGAYSSQENRKRRRPLWDVDGSMSVGKKKRRLRLDLITSRLSRPFSSPATNIILRSISNGPLKMQDRRSDSKALRRTAIMNRVRRRPDVAKAVARIRQQIVQEGPAYVSFKMQKLRPLYQYGRVPSSSSDYAALDMEYDMVNDQRANDAVPHFYSDFSVTAPLGTANEEGYGCFDDSGDDLRAECWESLRFDWQTNVRRHRGAIILFKHRLQER